MGLQVYHQTSSTGTYPDPRSGVQTQTILPGYPENNPNGQAIKTKEAQLPHRHPAQATPVHRYKMFTYCREKDINCNAQ